MRLLVLLFAIALAAPARADEAFAFLHEPPKQVPAGQSIELIGELYGAALIQTATVHWRSMGDKDWQASILLPAGGFLMHAVMLGDRVRPPGVEYWVEGTDLAGNKHALFGTSAETHLVPVAAPGELIAPELARTKPKPALIVPREPMAIDMDPEAAPPASVRVVVAKPIVPAPLPEQAPGTRRRKDKSSYLALYFPDEPATLAEGRAQKLPGASGSISVLGEDELKALGVRTVAEALALFPGLQDRRDRLGFHSAGALGQVDDAGVLVLYDGHPLNDAYDGRGFLEIPVENLERLEIQRGPGSVLNGPGALLATINIVPRRRDGITFSADGTTLAQGGLHFHGGGLLMGAQMDGDVDFQGGTGMAPDIGKDALTDALRTQGLLGATAPAGQLNDSGTLLNAGTRVVAPKLAGGTLELKLRYLHQSRGAYFGLYDVLSTDPASRIKRDVLLGDLSWRRDFGSAVSGAISLSADTRDEQRSTSLAPAGYAAMDGQGTQQTYTLGVHVRESWTSRTIGGEARVDVHPSELFRGLLTGGFRREQLAFYEPASDVTLTGQPLSELRIPDVTLAQRSSALGARNDVYGALLLQSRPVGWFEALAGARVDALSGAAGDGPTAVASGVPTCPTVCSLADRPSVTAFSPRVGLSFTPAASVHVHALYDHGVRAPTFEELTRQILQPGFLRNDTWGGFEGLKPVTSDALTLLGDWTDQLSWGRATARASVFTLSLHDDISPAALYVNSSQSSSVTGFTLEGRLERSRRFFARAALTVEKDSYFVPSDPVAQSSSNALIAFGSFGAGIPIGRWLDFSALLELATSDRTDDAHALLSASLRTEPLFGVAEAELTLHNAFNSPANRVFGTLTLPTDARSAALTLRARF